MNNKLKLRCIRSNGSDFVIKQKYDAFLINGQWCVEGFSGYKLPLEKSIHGNLAFISECRSVKIFFEPVMKD